MSTDAPPEGLDDIVALERTALDHWGRGDPDAYLELSAEDVTYFDPFVETRLDGLRALREHYAPLRGRIRIDRDEIVRPNVRRLGDAAVLTFRYASTGSEGTMHWFCTEVYERRGGRWEIVHTHWSLAKKTDP
jgi:ketosteroid isomerase-like protein